MPMILLIIVAVTLLLLLGLIIYVVVKQGLGPFRTKERHLMGPRELFPVVTEQLEFFLHKKVDELMATVTDIEAHAEQFSQLGYTLSEVSIYGNPLPGLALEFDPGVLSEDAAYQELLRQKHESMTFKLIVKLLQFIAHHQRKYQFRDLSPRKVTIRLGKEPLVQIVYYQMPKP